MHRTKKEVIDSSHLLQEKNPWGTHDKLTFTPEESIPVRCPKCNRLMSSDFLTEIACRCPNCNWRFNKKQARDMYVEAKAVKVNGGWTHEVLERLSGKEESTILGANGNTRPIDDVAKNMTAWEKAAKQRAEQEVKRRKEAEKRVLTRMREESRTKFDFKRPPPLI